MHINRLAALEGLGVDAESSGCHGEEKPGSICLACRWSSCVFFLTLLLCLMFWNIHLFFSAEAPAVILLDDCCRQMLRNSIWFCFLVVLFLCLLYYFSSGLLWGGRVDGCVVQEQGGTGFCVLSSAFQQYFLSHSHLQYLWQLNVSQEAERKVEVHFKTNTSQKLSLISALSCYTYTEDC